MKHAGVQTIAKLNDLCAEVRALPGVVEKKPGVFYRKGRAFLHFHEDPSGIHADVRTSGADFSRHRVETSDERDTFIAWLELELRPGV